VPVPRRFDRRPPERDTTRINERIRVPEVRLIDDEGKQIGVMKTADALSFAQDRELDLVEARPPVARVLDYSKYKYEQAQKQKQARKHQQQITIREIKFRPKIAKHDYDTKKHHVERFLRNKDKVKVTIMFRGREVTHPERGIAILDRLADELSELGVVEQRPMQEGRNMTMMMAPSKAVLAGRLPTAANAAGAEVDAQRDGDVASTALGSLARPAPPPADQDALVGGDGAPAPATESPPAADQDARVGEDGASAPARDSAPAGSGDAARGDGDAPAPAPVPAPAPGSNGAETPAAGVPAEALTQPNAEGGGTAASSPVA
jgi:translation initiation factor IF-3